MSEREVYVACTCYRDGLTTDPPLPRSDLTYDRFGNVTSRYSRTPDDDPEPLWEWRFSSYDWPSDKGETCAHDRMRLVCEIWNTAGWNSNERLRVILTSTAYPNLHRVLQRGERCGAPTVIASSSEARAALEELKHLSEMPVAGSAYLVQDLDGNLVRRIPGRDGPGPVAEIDRPTYTGARQEKLVEELLEVVTDGVELIVRRHFSEQELLRTMRLAQVVGDAESIRSYRDLDPEAAYLNLGQYRYSRIAYTDLSTGEKVSGFGSAIQYRELARLEDAQRMWSFPRAVTVETVAASLFDLSWPLKYLGVLLQAAVITGNPLVGYYNQQSSGLDE